MFFKEKKEVIYRKNKESYRIDIVGADYESGRDVEIIMNFIKKISSDKRIFVSTIGDTKTLDTDVIIAVKKEPISNTPAIIELEIIPDKIDAIEPLFDNMYTFIYICEQSMSWSDFLVMSTRRNVNSYFRSGERIACIGLYYEEDPWIELNKNYSIYMEELFDQLQIEQYSIKRKRI